MAELQVAPCCGKELGSGVGGGTDSGCLAVPACFLDNFIHILPSPQPSCGCLMPGSPLTSSVLVLWGLSLLPQAPPVPLTLAVIVDSAYFMGQSPSSDPSPPP